MSHKQCWNFSLCYFNRVFALINLALITADRNLSISFFTNLLKTPEIIWSIFSLLILKEYKAIRLQTLFECKHYLDYSRFLFYVLVSCFHNPNFGFVVRISQLLSLKNKLAKFYNIHYLACIIKFSFNFYLFMFKDFLHSNSSKLLIWFISFSVTFLTKPYKHRLSSSNFLLSFLHWAITLSCDLILLSSFSAMLNCSRGLINRGWYGLSNQ